MSNLYKYISSTGSEEVRVIDYNPTIQEKIEKLQKELKARSMMEEKESAGFVQGLDPFVVEELVEEEIDYEQQVEEMLEQARTDAQAIRQEALDAAEQMREAARQSGKIEGYNEGRQQAAVELEEEKLKLKNQQENMEREYQQKIHEIEPMLIEAILPVFEKVTKVLTKDKKNLILHLVNSVMERAESSKEFLIRVSKQDGDFLREHKEEINGATNENCVVEILEDATLEPLQCLIETDSGVYDCSLDTQLTELIEAVKILSCQI